MKVNTRVLILSLKTKDSLRKSSITLYESTKYFTILLKVNGLKNPIPPIYFSHENEIFNGNVHTERKLSATEK